MPSNVKLVSVHRVVIETQRMIGVNSMSAMEKEDLINWTAIAERKINSFTGYVHEEKEFKIENLQVEIPCDCVMIRSIKYGGEFPMITDSDFQLWDKNCPNLQSNIRPGTISVRNGFIRVNGNTEEESGTLQMAYKRWPRDKNGLPLVPESHVFADSLFCAFMFLQRKSIKDPKVANAARSFEQQWYWNCGQVRGDDGFPDELGIETLQRIWNNMIPPMYLNTTGNYEM